MLAQTVVQQVTAFISTHTSSTQAIEQAVLRGLTVSSEALEQLTFARDSARVEEQAAETISDALLHVEQKLAFFQGCTMRRSAALTAHDEEAAAYAAEAERLAAAARATATIDRLVEAYKTTETIEARIIELRGTMKTGSAPEPRVLDMARARVLVARRAIGSAVVDLDSSD